MATIETNSQDSVATYYRNANTKYNQQSHDEPLNTPVHRIPPIDELDTTKVLYEQFPNLKLIQQPVSIIDDCPIQFKLYTSTPNYTNSMQLSFSNSKEEMEGWFRLIVNHCCYVLYLVKNHFHPALSYNFLREVYITYAKTMGSRMLSHHGKNFDKIVKAHRQHLFNNDERFCQWLDEQYNSLSQSSEDLEIKDMHAFAFWSKDLCDDNDIVTHFLPNKVNTLFKQHVDDLLNSIKPKTKKQWMSFFSEFQYINQMIVWYLESRETDPLLLSHIKEQNKGKITREIIREVEFLHLSQYGYEILICGYDTTLKAIKWYFDSLDSKDRKLKSEIFFNHLKETINKKIIEPNTSRAHLSTTRLLDVYITLFEKLDSLKIDYFNDVFREALYPILETLQKRSDLFSLLSYFFYNNRKEFLDCDKIIQDGNDIQLLDKFCLLISEDKSISDNHGQQVLSKKDVSSWFKRKYLHSKLYSEDTLKVKIESNKFEDYVDALGEVKYNANLYVNEESVILQVINSLTSSNKEGFLSTFIRIYQNYLLSICDRDKDDWKRPFTLLLKVMFKGNLDNSSEQVETAIKTMLLDMAVSTHDYGNYALQHNHVELMVLAGEYWNMKGAPKYTEILHDLLCIDEVLTSLGDLVQKYKLLHQGQQLLLNGQKSTMTVRLSFDDGRVISKRCSILEGALINKISSMQCGSVSVDDLLCIPEFTCFEREEIEESLDVWEAMNVLYKDEDHYEVIEDLHRFSETHILKGPRKRGLSNDHEETINKKVMKMEPHKDERLQMLNGFFGQLVVSTLEARQGGLGALEIKEWLSAALPEYAKKNIPKMKRPSTKDEEITMEDYLDYLVSKGKLKKSKTGVYYSKGTVKKSKQ